MTDIDESSQGVVFEAVTSLEGKVLGEILEGIKLETNHFETQVELLCKLFKKKIYPLQIPINYKARSKAEGKKINFFRDGISFLKVLIKYRFFH